MKLHGRSLINNSLWLLLYASTAVFAAVFNTTSTWLSFYFFTFFLGFNALAIAQPLSRLQLKKTDDILLPQGERQEIELVFTTHKQRTLFYAQLHILITLKGHKQKLESRQTIGFTKNFSLTMEPFVLSRGIYEHPKMVLISSDFFGIWQRRLSLKLPFSLIVPPQFKPDEADAIMHYLLQAEHSPFQSSHLKSFDLKKIREYQPGDRVNLIDWKLSSKKQEIMVKEFEDDKTDDPVFIFYGSQEEEYEETLSVFYSLYRKYLEATSIDTLVFNGDMLIKNPVVDEFIRVQPITDDGAVLTALRQEITPFMHKIIITTQPDPALNKALTDEPEFHNTVVIILEQSGKLIALYGDRIERIPRHFTQ